MNKWPADFDLRDDPALARRIKGFINEEMARLKELDNARRKWIKENLPATYEMTYVFSEHAVRVAKDVKKTAQYMGLKPHVCENLYWAMLPHDIGKARLPPDIWDTIEKPENETKKLRRSHTDLGAKIVENKLSDIEHPFKELMLDIMLYHHEQMDGGGFHGLRGDMLSAPVRLACIVESFDGYSIARPHFGARDISTKGVLKRMRDEKGADLYDMELFEAFYAMKMSEAA